MNTKAKMMEIYVLKEIVLIEYGYHMDSPEGDQLQGPPKPNRASLEEMI